MAFYRFLLLYAGICAPLFPAAQRNAGPFTATARDTYSLDRLPAGWLTKPNVLRMIDDVLPATIEQLKNSRSCTHCKARYSVTVQLDTVYILSQEMINKSAWGGPESYDAYGPQVDISFRFKSFLSIRDSTGREFARLMLADPETETYRISEKVHKPGRTTTVPVVYFTNSTETSHEGYSAGLVPTDNELLNLTQKKLKLVCKYLKRR